MKETFYKTPNPTHRPFNIKVNQNNTTKCGNKSLRSLRNGLVQNVNAIYVLI